jgi:predicted nucleotidyltransferase
MIFPSDIGTTLARARRAYGVTQRELGERICESQPQIARWEATSYRSAALERVDEVARALGIDTALMEIMPLVAEAPAAYAPARTSHGVCVTEEDLMGRLGTDPETLAALCAAHDIVEFGVFGSVLRSDFGADSDVDVLVRFSEETLPAFGDLEDIVHELSSLFSRDVDLVQRSTVERSENYLRRREILGGLRNLYAA